MSSLAGLYAICGLASALNLISLALGHAAVVTATIHDVLPRNRRCRSGGTGTVSKPRQVARGADR
jgi:hypothetical protein